MNSPPKINSKAPAPEVRLFGDLHCEEALFRIKITHDKFLYAAFVEDVKQDPAAGTWGDVVCRSANADYHAHIAWMDEKTAIRFQIGYYTDGPEPSLVSEKTVNAENCMSYVGQFFANDSAQAHIHADFDLKSSRRSKFPLPLKTTIGTCKTEIDGIGLKLSDAPSGVTQLWMVQRRDRFSAQLYADRKVIFKDFSVARELRELMSVLEGLTEETV